MLIARLLLAGVVVLLGGCASIVTGQNQSVSVETIGAKGSVAGAKCQLTNNKGTWFVTTPGTSVVQRSYEDLAVKCEHDAHDTGMTTAKSSTKPMAFGNAIFGGLIGVGVDISTGAAYDYPPLITVKLGLPRNDQKDKTSEGSVAAANPQDTPRPNTVEGLRITVVDFEPVSGVKTGETTFAISSVRDSHVELNDGSIVVDRTNGRVSRGAFNVATISGIALLGQPRVGQTSGMFHPASTGAAAVPVTLQVGNREILSRPGGSVEVVRVDVSGYAGTDMPYGTPGSHRGAPMNGTVYIDPVTGLVVSGDVSSVNGVYALKREMDRVVSPRATPSSTAATTGSQQTPASPQTADPGLVKLTSTAQSGIKAAEETPKNVTSQPLQGSHGQDSPQVLQLARKLACQTSKTPTLVAKGPGFEVFSVTCEDGETRMFRCEFGNCRELR